MKKIGSKVAMVLFALCGLGIVISQFVIAIQMKQNMTGYLKQAADASSVETAMVELKKSLDYLEEHEMTEGYTSIFWKTEDENVGFFYNNLKGSYNELSLVTDSTSQLEKSNLLMKLRETIIDHGSDGDKITIPDGLHKFPHNFAWMLMNIIAGLFFVAAFVCWLESID